MRKFTLLLFTTIALIASAEPNLKWLNYSHNFGLFKEEDGLVYCAFKAINTGNEPVVIIDARANCGCTQPTYPREPIAPGDTLTVKVAYNPQGRPGKFNKQVKLTTNAKIKTNILTVKGVVIGSPATLKSRYPQEVGSYRINNNMVHFGSTIKGRVLAGGVQIYNPTTDTIKPLAKDIPDYINVLFKPVAIPPGDQGIMSLTAYTDRMSLYGPNEGTLTLYPSKDSSDSIIITTIAKVNQSLKKLTQKEIENAPVAKLSESSIDFGTIDTLKTSANTKSFTITNLGHDPLTIHRVYSDNKAIDISVSSQKVNHGKKSTIKISLNTALLDENQKLKGILDSNITIITNDPKTPEQTIRAVGQLK